MSVADVRFPCRACGKSTSRPTKELVLLCGGAVNISEVLKVSELRQEARAFVAFSWRSPPQMGGQLLRVELVDQPDDDQFEYPYCSISCLRAWLNSKLDELEALSEDFLRDEGP